MSADPRPPEQAVRGLIEPTDRAVKLGAIGLICCAAVAASLIAAPDRFGFAGGVLAALMIAVAVSDVRRQIIPDELNIGAFLVGLLSIAADHGGETLPALVRALAEASVIVAVFLLFRWAYRRLRSRQGIGLGDVKLAGVAGVWLSWSGVATAVEIAALAAIGLYLARQAIKRATVSATARLPFGAFFGPAIWLCWLFETISNRH